MKVKLEDGNLVFTSEGIKDDIAINDMWDKGHHLFVCKRLTVRRKKKIAILAPSVQNFKLKGMRQ